KKAKAGAVFFQTQTVFDVKQYKQFAQKVKHLNVKVLPGVMLLKSTKFIEFLQKLPGVNIPQEVIKRIESAKDPLKEGIKICAETIKELKSFADGVHIMAIGMEEYIPQILEEVNK
ncbi:methylenetetrahydrofolate reductase, partial [Elusimicrobiota bacterium]